MKHEDAIEVDGYEHFAHTVVGNDELKIATGCPRSAKQSEQNPETGGVDQITTGEVDDEQDRPFGQAALER